MFAHHLVPHGHQFVQRQQRRQVHEGALYRGHGNPSNHDDVAIRKFQPVPRHMAPAGHAGTRGPGQVHGLVFHPPAGQVQAVDFGGRHMAGHAGVRAFRVGPARVQQVKRCILVDANATAGRPQVRGTGA
ncbi:hypothetical protein [Arthrobacter sp. SDTb3-6]|uniref:hypothetical protein n=1 Tax=Arthrobacter sp. SDTb3-6 TaxID=2713571 RepID=UPI00159E230D|nr:hypothetical protein [Arthrobacter sp. SDTb3-6]NVM99786.1 hypothetical protein [Arthrobacter sp. SDTb3-6]